MRRLGTKSVLLADLKANLFVRQQLDADHVVYLAQLIEAGVNMRDPIEVTADLSVVDGRQRREAYDLAGVTSVTVRVIEFESEAELISYAYRSNVGGSLPPTPADTEHTVMLLLDRGEPKRRIGELLGLPTSLARKYIAGVEAKRARALLQEAVSAVAEGGLTVAKAAERFGVDLDQLKEKLSGQRPNGRENLAEVQRKLSNRFRSGGQKNAALLRSLLEGFGDGDVTEKQAKDIFRHLERLQLRSIKAVADWRSRFEALVASRQAEKL